MMELELKTHFPHQYAWLGPLGTSLEKAEDYPLDIRSYEDKTKVLVTCGTQLPWAKEEFARTNQAVGQRASRMSLFSSP